MKRYWAKITVYWQVHWQIGDEKSLVLRIIKLLNYYLFTWCDCGIQGIPLEI